MSLCDFPSAWEILPPNLGEHPKHPQPEADRRRQTPTYRNRSWAPQTRQPCRRDSPSLGEPPKHPPTETDRRTPTKTNTSAEADRLPRARIASLARLAALAHGCGAKRSIPKRSAETDEDGRQRADSQDRNDGRTQTEADETGARKRHSKRIKEFQRQRLRRHVCQQRAQRQLKRQRLRQLAR